MNCGYCGRKCDLDKDFCIPQDSVYVCKSCYEWQNRVADLETKLAEMTEKYNACHEARKLEIEFNQQDKAELKQQLEEYKQSLKETIDHYEKYCSEINRQNIMLYAAACNAQQSNQNKILFAVEQLEKVKEFVNETSGIVGHEWRIDRFRVLEHIDNQIKQLKETA